MISEYQNDKDVYWFAQTDTKKLTGKLYPSRENSAVNKSTAIKQVWQRNISSYYSAMVEPSGYDSSLNFGGAEGELVEMIVPMARSVTRQLVSIVTKQRLAFNVLADNTESGTIQAARLGTSLTKSVIQKQAIDEQYETFFENSCVTGMGVFAWRWRTDKGEYFTQDMFGVDHFKGDVEVSVPNIWEIEFDARIKNPKEWQWVQIPYMHNRWDLIAQFPHLEEQLKKTAAIDKSLTNFMQSYEETPSKDDLIYIYVAYHVPSPALPEGRMIAYANPDCVLYDGPNIYKRLPIAVSKPEGLPNSAYGYPYLCNLLPAQEMLDNTMSSIATNNAAFGVQAIKAPRKSNVSPEQIWGMNFFFYDKTTEGDMGPEPINFTASSPESWKFVDTLKSFMLDLSMINSALRGDPPTGVTSGAAIATLTTTALESVASSSKSARAALRDLMMGVIDAYRRMASVERELEIPGSSSNQMELKSFKGSDLDGIRDIQVVEMNPLMQTQMGRETQAEKLLQFGLITNVKGYFSIIEGAPVSELYMNELSQEDLVKRENESMLAAEPVLVVNIDDHPYHIMMHSMLLNDPRVRMNGQMLQQVLAHIAEHDAQEKEIDPHFAAMVRTGKAPQMALPPPGGDPSQGGGVDPSQRAPGGSEEQKKAKPANPAKDQLGRDGQTSEVA